MTLGLVEDHNSCEIQLKIKKIYNTLESEKMDLGVWVLPCYGPVN